MDTHDREPQGEKIRIAGEPVRVGPAWSRSLPPNATLPPTALVYAGFGMVVSNRARDWWPGAEPWVSALSILLLVGGAAWWVVLWRQAVRAKRT